MSWSWFLTRSCDLLQLDGILRANLHAEAAAPAGVRDDDEGLLAAVDEELDACEQEQAGLFYRGYGADCEYVVGADRDAGAFGFAARGVDDGDHDARREFAIVFGLSHVSAPLPMHLKIYL